MLLLIGIILVVVGLSDLGVASVIQRQHAAADPSGLGAEQQPVSRLLRLLGYGTIALGAVLVVIGLLA